MLPESMNVQPGNAMAKVTTPSSWVACPPRVGFLHALSRP